MGNLVKVTNFGPGGFPKNWQNLGGGITSVNSNFNTTDGGLSAVNFVQRITANSSNVLLNPIVNFAAGSNILLTLDQGPLPAQAYPSNTIRIHSTASGGGSISAGSNSTWVQETSTAGASTTLWSPFDHAHAGIQTVTASSSNTMQRGTLNLRTGTNISFGLTDTDGDGEFDTLTINNTAAAGGGGGGTGSSGALVFLESHTASSSATLDFTTAISSTYETYKIEFVDLLPANNNVNLLMRVGTGGGPTYDSGANYAWFENTHRNGGGDTNQGATSGATSMQLAGDGVGVSNSANFGVSGSITFANPNSAIYKKHWGQMWWYYDTGADPVLNIVMGTYRSTTAVTALRFLMSSGNISSGTIRVYGVSKS